MSVALDTIADVQSALHKFGVFARKVSQRSDAVAALQKKWQSLFSKPLSKDSAESFVEHYRKMATKAHKQRATRRRTAMHGGMAPVDHVMTPPVYTPSPGNIGVYGNFPTEYGANPGAVDSMDRYFGSALQAGCGVENSSLTPPVEMGSNQVGGAVGRRGKRRGTAARSRKQRRVTRRRTSRKSLRKQRKSMRRKYIARGGDLSFEMLRAPLPYLASVPPSAVQTASNAIAGAAGPAPSDPVAHTWQIIGGTPSPINPGTVTQIGNTFSNLAQFGVAI